MVGIVDILLNRGFNRFGTPPILPDSENRIPGALGMPGGISPVSAPISTVTSRPSVFNTPGQNEELEPSLGGRISSALNSPLGILGAQLLARSGPSLTPQSTLSNIGGALVGAQQIGRQSRQDELRQRLIESRIGIQGQTNTNVQSTFQGENGNMFIVTRDGQVKDTGVPFNTNVQVVENDDGTIDVINRSTGEVMGTPVGEDAADRVASRAAEQAATRAGQVRTAQDTAAAEVERRTEEPQRQERLRSQLGDIARIWAEVDQAVEDTGVSTAGFIGSVASGIPGTPARDLRSTITTIKANLGFQELQRMRENSPTGGALGQVAVQELNALQSVVASLDQEQSPDQLRENLQKISGHLARWEQAVRQSQSQGSFEGFEIIE